MNYSTPIQYSLILFIRSNTSKYVEMGLYVLLFILSTTYLTQVA